MAVATLRPVYAYPSDDQHVPHELVLEANSSLHQLVFQRRADLLTFQQAVTGYLVAENYVE
jgi:hypothetical protein